MNYSNKEKIRDAWDYIYGSKSHMNLAGKILLGIPAAPFVITILVVWIVLDLLFKKESK